MIQSRRRRHRSIYLQEYRSPALRRFLGTTVVGVLVVWGMWSFLARFAPDANGKGMATVLTTGDRGRVEVTISGEKSSQRAETGLRLYDGDRIRTEGGAHATLHFFDTSVVMLDPGSAVQLTKVWKGNEKSEISLVVEEGRVWVNTSTGTTVTRRVDTGLATHVIPPRTRAIVGDAQDTTEGKHELLAVFETSGPGVEVSFMLSSRTSALVVVGEGQEINLSPERIGQLKEQDGDPYSLRAALDDRHLSSGLFIAASSYEAKPPPVEIPEEEEVVEGEQLVVEEPADGSLLPGSTVLVKGTIGSQVAVVRVNGYSAILGDGTFEKEIAMPDEEKFTLEVQAEDRDGLIIDTKSLALLRDIQPPDAPSIISPFPSKLGEPLQVNDDSFEIVGGASGDTTSIIVNGYQLQKFRTGQQWRYLVDPDIGNVRLGENTYEIVAADRAGNRSKATTIMIVWKAQPLLVADDRGSARDESAYLSPGSLRIIAPTSGEPYVTSKVEVLIEGETVPETHSISVNGFTLTLYLPGKVTWNYIAKEAFGNYKRGVNRYVIVSRNSEGKILDVLRYVIERK